MSPRATRLALLATSLLLSLALLEVAVRFTWVESYYGYPEGLHIPDDRLGYKYQPGFVGYFPNKAYRDVQIRINSGGLRDSEHDYLKPENTVRIIGIGDSVMFGAGLPQGDIILSQLERQMRSSFPTLETVNAAVDGYQISQIREFFNDEIFKYESDLVLYGVVLNDIFIPDIDILKKIYSDDSENKITFKRFLMENYRTLRLARVTLRNITEYGGRNYNEYYFDMIYRAWRDEEARMFDSELSALNRRVIADGSNLLLVVFPYTEQFRAAQNYDEYPQQRIGAIAARLGIDVVDLTPHFDVDHYRDYYLFNDSVHLNAEGSRRAAEALEREFMRLGTLEPSGVGAH